LLASATVYMPARQHIFTVFYISLPACRSVHCCATPCCMALCLICHFCCGHPVTFSFWECTCSLPPAFLYYPPPCACFSFLPLSVCLHLLRLLSVPHLCHTTSLLCHPLLCGLHTGVHAPSLHCRTTKTASSPLHSPLSLPTSPLLPPLLTPAFLYFFFVCAYTCTHRILAGSLPHGSVSYMILLPPPMCPSHLEHCPLLSDPSPSSSSSSLSYACLWIWPVESPH